jgi:hypothetical protein
MKSPQLIKTFGFFALFIFFYGCTTEEITYITNNNAEGLGKVNVYIEGNMTNAEAQAKLNREIGTLTENIYVRNTTQVTDVEMILKQDIRNIYFANNTGLKNIHLQGTNNKMQDFEIADNHYLNKISIKGITKAQNVTIGHMAEDYNLNEFIDIECRDLVTVEGYLTLFIGQWNHPVLNKLNFYDLRSINKIISNGYACRWQGRYSEFNMPKLESVEDLQHYINVQEVSYPNLKEARSLVICYGSSHQIMNFNALEKVRNLLVYDSNNGDPWGTTSVGFTNPDLRVPVLNYCVNFNFFQPIHTSEQVNSILNKFLTIMPVSGKSIWVFGAPPTGQGLIDKQTLINQGNIVETN